VMASNTGSAWEAIVWINSLEITPRLSHQTC
jgi:hypothetical protein